MTWDYWESRPRIRPENGIRARAKRGRFGETWWAGRWIAALERITNEGRLERGRTYARGGQVLTLDVGMDGVSAKVQGSRVKPYQVSIRFRGLADAEWERVLDAMAGQAIFAAKLLAGEMPEQIEDVFADVGTSLLPAAAKDLVTDCSCPDWSNPCKHVAAVYYLLGERFDDDPFLMFELRGRSKEALLDALRERRGVAMTAADEGAATTAEGGTPAGEALETDPARFWRMGADAATLTFSFEAPPVDALPVRRLGAPPFWPDAPGFTTIMEQVYRTIGEHTYALVTDYPEDE